MKHIQSESFGSRLPVHHVTRGRALAARAPVETPVEVPPFPIHIRSPEGQLRAKDRAHVRNKLARRLGKFAEAIERITLRCEDVNGPRGG